jgi:isochorismate pyruvate lyase
MKQRTPANCASMAELRLEIDRIDRHLIGLLSQRSGYIDRAVDLKRVEGLPARTVDRVEEVLQNVRTLASEQGLDQKLVEALWRHLIEWSILKESLQLER